MMTFHNKKPFTLDWWLEIMEYHWAQACDYSYKCHQVEAREHIEIAKFIKQRLQNGESTE